MNKHVMIIGGGIGGFALAQGLTNAGIKVTVYERDESPDARDQGYRISIRSLGKHALTELLSPEQQKQLEQAKVADVGDAFTLANEQMEPFFTVPLGQDAAIQYLRSKLRNCLMEGIDIKWGKRLCKFEETNAHVTAHFDDGTQAAADLLVGCDGCRSITRELLRDQNRDSIPKVIPGNHIIIGGQIDRTPNWNELLPLNKTGLVRFLGPGSHYLGVCFSERIDRSPTIFWAFSEEINKQTSSLFQSKEILSYAKQLIKKGAWHSSLIKLVYETKEEAIFPPWFTHTTIFPTTPQFPLSTFGRVTLLGDAAHAMGTEKGLGGNNVLEDARLLTSLLPTAQNWPQAITQYEKEMFARAKVAVQESDAAADRFSTLCHSFK